MTNGHVYPVLEPGSAVPRRSASEQKLKLRVERPSSDARVKTCTGEVTVGFPEEIHQGG